MKKTDAGKSTLDIHAGPTDCPFREFRDNELSTESWGLGPIDYKSVLRLGKGVTKSQGDQVWVDTQIQPLPSSARKRLHAWVRAEDLALSQWDAEVSIFDDNNGGKMSIADIQFAYYQVLQMSSFCRRALSACYILEKAEEFSVEHQWENFVFSIPPEGWRARYHIYSPGLKHGGGIQHRPTLSKNGCYLVRLFYIGAWRCVWVSDQVPVDAADCPLLPFAPYFNQTGSKPGPAKQAIPFMSNPTVLLWPLLLCKALLKLAAPGMDEIDPKVSEDQVMTELDILHALTGSVNLTYNFKDVDRVWKLITLEVPLFVWDEDDETLASTIRPKAKKVSAKETAVFRHRSITSIFLGDTRNLPPYILPGITPAFEMSLIVTMARDLPLKKPLSEPEVALWKKYRWVDWAWKHGLYEAYECPRTKFLKLNGLLKLSQAPHLLDVQSTDSITFGFREEHGRTNPAVRKYAKETNRSATTNQTMTPQMKEELREWMKLDMVIKIMKNISILYYPSMYQFSSIASNPPIRITKASPNKQIDIPASKTSPLYLQLDGPEENVLRISCAMLHPRVLLHAGQPIDNYVEPGYVLLEKFKWFDDCELPKANAYLQTRGYDATEISFTPGRHFFRLWIHSRVPWHIMLLSDSTICVGTRDVIQAAATRECPWSSKFLNSVGTAFQNFLRMSKSNTNVLTADRDFYRSYQPDLHWNSEEVGYSKSHLHWMFRKAVQSILNKRLHPFDYRSTCAVLQYYFNDPEFGLSKNISSFVSTAKWAIKESCDCSLPDPEELEICRVHYNDMLMDVVPSTADLTHSVCDITGDTLSCGHLKTIRDMTIRWHDAATHIQAFWRGVRARKCVETRVAITPEIMKCLTDNVFGNLEALSALMNEFFNIFPGAKGAYSVASGLVGTSGLKQHLGSIHVTPRCVWIPFFQVVFFCHTPVMVHLDLQSTIGANKINSTVEVYDNDTKEMLPQPYNTHFTLNFSPNNFGFTVIGHGTLKQPMNVYSELHWQLNVMSSIANVFHVCDCDVGGCKELPIQSAVKVHVDQVYVPNQRNILGGLAFSVPKQETICFRASASSSELEMEAVLKTRTRSGKVEELMTLTGRGEIYWQYVRLESDRVSSPKSPESANMPQNESDTRTQRNPKLMKPIAPALKRRSTLKIRESSITRDTKTYIIEVRATQGWPLTVAQWRRAIDIQNQQESKDSQYQAKKSIKEKTSFAKDRVETQILSFADPQPGDAYVELECSLSGETGTTACYDDYREQQFTAAVKSWDLKQPGRNATGAQIRKKFREEHLENITQLDVDNADTNSNEIFEDLPEQVQETFINQHGPTPATRTPASGRTEIKKEETNFFNVNNEITNEATYLTMPDELKDKFTPLDFVPLCTRETTEDERTILTPEMAEASKRGREAMLEAAIERMNQLQNYYEVYVLEMQKTRCDLLEQLFVDSQWSPGLTAALEARDSALISSNGNKTTSMIRKKQDSKTK